MPASFLHSLLAEKQVLLADGATGTNYFMMGLGAGDPPELWNVEHADRVADLHRRFITAGADIVLTNSFGGTHYRLDLHKAGHRVRELNVAAATIAVSAAREADRRVLVAGSIGPTGEIFAPVGTVSEEDGEAAFRAQAEALAEGGADLIWIETLSSREEMRAALSAAAGVGLPIVCTLSFDTNGSTMMGVTPAEFAGMAPTFTDSLHGCGTNCGVGAAEVVACLNEMRTHLDERLFLVAKANCGIPKWVDDKIAYDGTPELMADYVRLAYAAGARIIGGCCGTTPSHLSAMRAAIDDLSGASTARPDAPEIRDIEARLGPVSSGLKRRLAGGGEPAPPRRARRRRTRSAET